MEVHTQVDFFIVVLFLDVQPQVELLFVVLAFLDVHPQVVVVFFVVLDLVVLVVEDLVGVEWEEEETV